MTENKIYNINSDSFASYYLRENHKKIEIVKKLIKLGHHCLVISDPPTRSINAEINEKIKYWDFYDQQSLKVYNDIGCDTLNAGAYFGEGKFESRFFSDVIYSDGTRDWFHGSDAYYSELAMIVKNNCFK